MTAHSIILAWETPWTWEPDGLHFMGSQRDGHDLATKQHLPWVIINLFSAFETLSLFCR